MCVRRARNRCGDGRTPSVRYIDRIGVEPERFDHSVWLILEGLLLGVPVAGGRIAKP